MDSRPRTYIAIDLKSFYSSVECVARGLDPLTTNLVVADVSRTEKTICLAVSPSMKAYGLGGRARLFEVIEKMREVNETRRRSAGVRGLSGSSCSSVELQRRPELAADYIAATPRMAEYIRVSSQVYGIYLRYISSGDIHVYSIDEVFMDVTSYLAAYKMTAHQLARAMIADVLKETGVTATAGIGSNLYLCKVAMDIVAKHIPADEDGVRIAELDEDSYRRTLWDHRPLTDFWRFGRGIAARLAPYGVDTMGKLARMSLSDEVLLYRLFGVNAELVIDHAWGWEPVTMDAVKSYRPGSSSVSSGQVLQSPYSKDKARVVVLEMAGSIAMELTGRRMACSQVVLTIGYDAGSLADSDVRRRYRGDMSTDWYGRAVPKHARSTESFGHPTSSASVITAAVKRLYEDKVNPLLKIRRIGITAGGLISEDAASGRDSEPQQLDLFDGDDAASKEQDRLARERRLQETLLRVRMEFGKNSLLRGIDFDEGATGKERNGQIGGHKA